MVRQRIEPTVRTVAKQGLSLLLGSAIIGAAVGFLVEAERGLAPYDVLSDGVADRLGLSLGQAGWVVAAVLFAAAIILGRRPSPWGVGYIIANGLAVDATNELLQAPNSTLGQVLYIITAIVLMASGVNIVLYSGTTGGPFELLMLAGQDRGVKPIHVRYALDASTLALGVVLGGAFGIATLIYAALMGIVLELIRQVFNDYDHGRQLRLATAQTP